MSFFSTRSKPSPTADVEPSKGLSEDFRGQLEAINKSQAVIEFEMNGNILRANDNFLKTLGYTLNEVQGKHHRMFVDPAYGRSREYADFWANLNRGKFDAGEYMRLAKDGREIWIHASYNPIFDDQGRPVKVVKFAADITEQKLRASEAAGQISAINKSQAVIEFELDGTIINANKNFLDTVGYTLEEVRGKHHQMFVDPEYALSQEYKEFWASLRQGIYQSNEYKRYGKGGREVWIQASYNPILDPQGRPVKVVKFATDITAQVETKHRASAVGNDVASSVSEMVATIDEIARNVTRTASLAKEAEGIATTTGTSVLNLGESSRKIGEVVSVIQELADQTNLLALNATIEAARAGESGRSFAVVASEVKELANATAKATQNIELSVRQIQESIEEVVDSTGRITNSIGEVSSNTTTVAAAIEEQSATMANLGQTAEQLQTITSI